MLKLFYLLSAAATTKISSSDVNIPNLGADSVLHGALNIVYFAAGVVAVIVIIISGFFFLTSAGQPEKITTAKKTILYAVVGLVVVICAFIITQFIVGRF